MNGEPSSVGAPRTAMSASRRSRSVQMADPRNEGIPTNGKPTRPPPSSCGMLWLLMADEFVLVPAREARAVRVPPGGRFRVVDLEGGQVVDLFAFAAGDVGEY